MAKRVASPDCRVNFTSKRSKRALSCHCSSITYRRARPPPDTGFIIIRQRLMVDSYVKHKYSSYYYYSIGNLIVGKGCFCRFH